MEPFFGLLAATAIGVALAVAQLVFARLAGLAPYQANLIGTLKDNADALEEKVDRLESELGDERAKRKALEASVSDLRVALADLATENAALRRQLGMPPK